MFSLHCKLSSTLSALCTWSKSHIGNIPVRIKQGEHLLNHLYCQLPPSGIFDVSISEAIVEARNELEFLYECENSFWEQRAKLKWRSLGERNTKYFHSVVNNRFKKNLILKLKKPDGNWTTD